MVTIIVNPLSIPGAPFTWHSGEQWQVAYSFSYESGSEETIQVYLDIKSSSDPLAITNHIASDTLTLPAALNGAVVKTSTITLTVPSTNTTIDIGTYDLILNVSGVTVTSPGAIIVAAGSGNFVTDRTYKSSDYDTYNGNVDQGTYSFNLGPNAMPFTNSVAISLFDTALINAAKDNDSDVLTYTVYRDPSNNLVTPYKIDITFKSPDQSTIPAAASLEVSPQSFPLKDTIIMGIIGIALIALGIIFLNLPLVLTGLGIAIIVPVWHWLFGKGGPLGGIGSIASMIGSIIPLILVMLIMKMMMEQMAPKGTPTPVTDKVVSGAKAVGRGIMSAAPVVGGFVGDLVAGPVGGAVGTAGGAVLGGAATIPPPYEEGYSI
jgi:hypothetical protein